MSNEFFRQHYLFSGLDDADIDMLASMSELVDVPQDGLLLQEGKQGDALYLIAEGEFQVTKRSGMQDVPIAVRGPGQVLGEISLLDDVPHIATVRAMQASRVYKISRATFNTLIRTRPAATLAILRTVTARLRSTEAMLHQNEKMAALGTLSAGLAHELNNPASAAQRSAAQLRETLGHLQKSSTELGMLTLDEGQAKMLSQLHDEMALHVSSPEKLDPLTRSDRETSVQDWLASRGVDEAWELAPALVSYGWDISRLEKLCENYASDQLGVILRWLGNNCLAYSLLDEITQSAARISEIVKAVKSYSFLDQAPIQEIDVHDGLESTLVILRHKLKEGIHVTREYARNLPRIEAYGNELNQVWTNLIDNAIDAMQGKGELKIKTFEQDKCVVVEITDNGPGIPPEIQPRLFEAFFTTKPPGIGTGLGLHISYNIIQKHHGAISVTSKPGESRFQVKLPIQLEQKQAKEK